jgi:flagellar hook protein FlgE
MSLFGALLTSVSGMNAQSTKLGTVADNISNSSTTGYKRAETEFETLMGSQDSSRYAGGGVISSVRYVVSEQGTIEKTSSSTDIAIQGNGFFVVSNSDGRNFMTRAGAFVPSSGGDLVNSAGYYLMGQNLTTSSASTVPGIASLERVNINQTSLAAAPSTSAVFGANLPTSASVIAAADLPSANAATAQYTATNSLVAYDNLGGEVTLDIYFAKTAADTWEVSVYNRADASATGGFPYANAALATQTLNFDPTTGATTGATPMSIAIPNGQTMSLDVSSTTQLAADFSVQQTKIDGHAPSSLDHVEISKAGILSAVYRNGAKIDLYRIPLATVVSPDSLSALDGNVYAANSESGDMRIGAAQSAGFGSMLASSLEQSTVDLGAELTKMIETQRAYTANTKVFQASADLLDVINNFKV